MSDDFEWDEFLLSLGCHLVGVDEVQKLLGASDDDEEEPRALYWEFPTGVISSKAEGMRVERLVWVLSVDPTTLEGPVMTSGWEALVVADSKNNKKQSFYWTSPAWTVNAWTSHFPEDDLDLDMTPAPVVARVVAGSLLDLRKSDTTNIATPSRDRISIPVTYNALDELQLVHELVPTEESKTAPLPPSVVRMLRASSLCTVSQQPLPATQPVAEEQLEAWTERIAHLEQVAAAHRAEAAKFATVKEEEEEEETSAGSPPSTPVAKSPVKVETTAAATPPTPAAAASPIASKAKPSPSCTPPPASLHAPKPPPVVAASKKPPPKQPTKPPAKRAVRRNKAGPASKKRRTLQFAS